ncbi:macrophage mannose receptor 1-like [Patiria miniata]|uniref:C-type lectin domain-containing protein n=1 Tax=Patiria miniata TaxID=46514 RepID=A0A914BNR0_PATMI|nr:macrophage mannose receptor 1-like [Patiria miniata]
MAGLRVLGLLVLAVAVPLVYGVGCPTNFYRIGDICLSLLQEDDQTFADAEAKCKTLNSEATLAIVKDYRTQAQIVSFMSLDNTQDVYIGLKATPANPFYTWSDGTALDVSFTRWGVGQPDGYAFLTNTEYCVVLDNSNEKQPGYWYDVPCTEQHRYICSRKMDDSDNNKPIPGTRCTNDFIPLGNSACFYLYNDAAKSYDDAQAACRAVNPGPQYQVNLATVLSGYESALVETLMYSFDVPSAWIGLKSNNNEFGWEIDYPIVYTNWGTDEPSGQTGEGCVRARIDGDNWDDTTCADTAAYICRFDKLAMTYPTPDPATVILPCPNNWISQGENCYYFSDRKTDWGEANYRCMRMYEGAMLASITSSADNEFIYTTMKAKHPTEQFVWIGLTRVQTGNDNWGTFEWIDQKELNYALWSAAEPDGNDPNAALLESCVAMSINTAGAGAWLDEICQFSLLYSVCKLPKQNSYQARICGGNVEELKVGDQCYFPSTLLGPTQSDKTWTEAENKCREYGGHLTTVKDLDEQNLVRTLSFGFARSYWLGLRDEGAGFGWSDGTAFDISTDYSAFPSGQLPDNLAGEEDCTELRIWQNGEWGRSACGNLLKFVCKREESSTTPLSPLPGYPDSGECPKDYFRLDNMCFNLRGTDESQRLGWIDARDACKTPSVAGTTLATVSNPGQQALLTAIIQGVGADMWIGLNGIGIHDQYHWTDTTRLDYTSWAPDQPDNALPITDPNSASCVAMMNDPDDPGLWNDAMCTTPRAYLCQSPLVSSGGDPPPLPGNPCTDIKYSNYFDTCFLMESAKKNSFDLAKTDCESRDGSLLSLNNQYAGALFTYLLYQAGTDATDDEAWLGLRRNADTGVFEWVDKWPLQFTRWGPNEPNNNNGDCVALTRDGFWAVRQCYDNNYYFCKYPSTPPEVPGLKGGICPPDYVEFPESDDCYLFGTSATTIKHEAGDLTCATNHNGGRLPSIHSKAEEDFIKAQTKEALGENAKIWLGVTRNADDFNTWFDQSLMDYVNWDAGEPTDDNNANNNGVLLDVNGGWSDVASTERHNYICKSPKFPAPPTPKPTSSAIKPVAGWLSILLTGAVILFARR